MIKEPWAQLSFYQEQYQADHIKPFHFFIYFLLWVGYPLSQIFMKKN